MNQLTLTWTAISQEQWTSWPPDRPCAELAKDAAGMKRRIAKGIDVHNESKRYTQICNRIEGLAWQCRNAKKGRDWDGVDVYGKQALGLIELIHQLELFSQTGKQPQFDLYTNRQEERQALAYAAKPWFLRLLLTAWKIIKSFVKSTNLADQDSFQLNRDDVWCDGIIASPERIKQYLSLLRRLERQGRDCLPALYGVTIEEVSPETLVALQKLLKRALEAHQVIVTAVTL